MTNRRDFIKQLIAAGILLPAAAEQLSANDLGRGFATNSSFEEKPMRIALIGKGSQGTGDTNVALSVPNTKLVAVCDIYKSRLDDAKKAWGENIFVTENYKELLGREDIDLVIIATPDHLHQEISIAAMEAGKNVYCEKPVIHDIKEADGLIKAQKKTNKYFQAGSQGMASLGNRKAAQLVKSGILGKINFVDGQFTASPGVLGSYPLPANANEDNIDWIKFIGKAPKQKFNAQRLFYWRNWKDYGTGIAGDLFVHVIASLHFITGAMGPEKVYTTGGIRYYNDGFRDTPDVMLGYFDYPDKDNIGAFTLQLGANYVDGVSKKWGSMDFRIVGSEGAMNVGWNEVNLKLKNKFNPEIIKDLTKLGLGIDEPVIISDNEISFKVTGDYKGGHYNHFNNLITGIRENKPIECDVMFALRSAAPALLSYESYENGEAIYWDPVNLKKIKK
ncbi:MAG: Gfo/Idh/MocA family oxidoreductase [Bacteroidales bacterium]|nr:Gfo/Idh/MocA family oxidoreductase [Bacteroidales bacterium]